MKPEPNKPAAGNAGLASRLAIGHHRPGVGEPERCSATAHAERILKQTEATMVFSKGNAMKSQVYTVPIVPLLLALGSGCQVVNTGTETRMDEQMLKVYFENAQAQELFAKIIYGTDRETHVQKRVGSPSVSLYSRSETVAFNAHCNDHIRAADKNSDLLISQKEAEDYYRQLSAQGKITNRK